MSEFVRRSRKNETNTHDFELEELEKPRKNKSLEFFEAKVGSNLSEKMVNTVPRLPWQLERLIAAASSNVLETDVPGVHDVGRYVTAWGCSYLAGDRVEAERRLWQVYRAWRGVN